MQKFLLVSFLLFIGVFMFLPIIDTDFGWHYRCGKDLLEHGTLCFKNSYSYYLPDYQFYYGSFIYDSLIATLYDHVGFIGLSIVGSLTFIGIAYLLYRLLSGPDVFRFVLIFLFFYLSLPVLSFGFRPQVLTVMFLLLSLLIIQKAYHHIKTTYFLPLLVLVWVNTHIGFFISFITIGSFCIDLLIHKHKHWKHGLSVFLLSLFATLLNPFGYHIYEALWDHTTLPLNKLVSEWQYLPLLYVVLFTVASIITIVLLAKKKITKAYPYILLIVFTILSFKAVRNIPLYYAILGISLSNAITFKQIDDFLHENIQYLTLSIIIVAIFFSSIFRTPNTLRLSTSWDEYCFKGPTHYPCDITKKFPTLSGNIFAPYEFGGFLIWKTPHLKPFIDGRMPAWKDEHGRSPYETYLAIVQTQPGWNEVLRKTKTDYILTHRGTFLEVLLLAEGEKYGWKPMYKTEFQTLFKSSTAGP